MLTLNFSMNFLDHISKQCLFRQLTLSSGEYYVRIQHSNVMKNDAVIPLNYFLSQNYPNPFNPSTKIRYGLPKEGFVKITVYEYYRERDSNISKMDYKVQGYHVSCLTQVI